VLYSLRSGLSNEVSLGITFYLKKKKTLPEDVQKPYAPKSGQAKTKVDFFTLQKSPMSKL
jgi:hypothetical protein